MACTQLIRFTDACKSERVRAFQPPWRTVNIYTCPTCGHKNRISVSWHGPTPSGAFVCVNSSFTPPTPEQLAWQLDLINDQLSNNENASNAELDQFLREQGVSPRDCDDAIGFRGYFRTNPRAELYREAITGRLRLQQVVDLRK